LALNSVSCLSYFYFCCAIDILVSIPCISNDLILEPFSSIVFSLMSKNSRRVILSFLSSSIDTVVVLSNCSLSFSSKVTDRFKSSANSCNWCSIEMCLRMSPSYFCSCYSKATQFYWVFMLMSDWTESGLGSKLEPNSVRARSCARSVSPFFLPTLKSRKTFEYYVRYCSLLT